MEDEERGQEEKERGEKASTYSSGGGRGHKGGLPPPSAKSGSFPASLFFRRLPALSLRVHRHRHRHPSPRAAAPPASPPPPAAPSIPFPPLRPPSWPHFRRTQRRPKTFWQIHDTKVAPRPRETLPPGARGPHAPGGAHSPLAKSPPGGARGPQSGVPRGGRRGHHSPGRVSGATPGRGPAGLAGRGGRPGGPGLTALCPGAGRPSCPRWRPRPGCSDGSRAPPVRHVPLLLSVPTSLLFLLSMENREGEEERGRGGSDNREPNGERKCAMTKTTHFWT